MPLQRIWSSGRSERCLRSRPTNGARAYPDRRDARHRARSDPRRRADAKTPLTGTPSGFKDLDDLTGGFQPGNLVVLAARPGMGKSALASNIAENAALAGHAVVLFSLEMSEAELSQRFIASQARVGGESLRRGRVSDQQWPKIVDACNRLSVTPIFVDDSSDTGVLKIRAQGSAASPG